MPTSGVEIAGLKWVADFLKAVLTAVAGDRLKKRSSEETAKWRAFDVYSALARLNGAAAWFIEELRQLPAKHAQRDMVLALREVSAALVSVNNSLKMINPQLEIHAPEVAVEILRGFAARQLVASRAIELLRELKRVEEPADLATVVADAVQAKLQIEEAVESLRAFLASEFTFKESF